MRRVAVLIETSRTYGRELLQGVRQYVSEHEPWSVFAEIRDLESRPPAWLRTWDGDGILTRTGTRALANALKAVGLPTIELRSTRLTRHIPLAVGIDNAAVGQICAAHLRERGYRNFGVYELATEIYFEQRSHAFVEDLELNGFPCHRFQQSANCEKPKQWERQQTALVSWLRSLPKPVGILACTDQLGFWLLDACQRAELAVPDEVAVLGVENDESLCSMSSPPLSSVRLGGERVGYEACAILDRWMNGTPPSGKPKLIPPLGIVTRRSTDAVAVSDPMLALAIRRVREQACRGLRVDDLLREVPLSRSTLERGFREHLGRSPNMEIQRVKLQRAAELLMDTNLGLDAIAARTAFANKHYLSSSFRKMYGIPPGEYRRQTQPSGGFK